MDAENCLTVGAPHAGPLNSFETPSRRLHLPLSSRRSGAVATRVSGSSRIGLATGSAKQIPTGPAGLRDDKGRPAGLRDDTGGSSSPTVFPKALAFLFVRARRGLASGDAEESSAVICGIREIRGEGCSTPLPFPITHWPEKPERPSRTETQLLSNPNRHERHPRRRHALDPLARVRYWKESIRSPHLE
jgi:hypothetical protein